jgi:hypothetical protein
VIETLCGLPDGAFRRRVSCFYRDSYAEAPSWEASGSRVATLPGVLCPASLLHLSLLLVVIVHLPYCRFWCVNCVGRT